MKIHVHRKKNHFIFLILMIAAIFYLAMSVYFMDHFFPGTQINQEDYSFKSVSKTEELLLSQIDKTSLTLSGRDGEREEVTLEALGGHYEAHNEILKFKREQNGFLWPRMFWCKDSYRFLPEVIFEEETFWNTLQNLACMKNGKRSQNARIIFTDTGYQVQEEVRGTVLDKNAFCEGVRLAFSHMEPELDLEACYEKPEICADSPEFQKITAKLDVWMSARISYEIGEEPLVVDARQMEEWIDISEGTATLLTNKIEDYVDKMADTYDALTSKRVFYSTLRGRIVISDKVHSWNIDREAEKKALLSCIQTGGIIDREPFYLTPKGSHMGSQIGDTYVEVDLTAQHLWVYRDGRIVTETDVVTGNTSRKQGTPPMLGYIYNKERNRVLRGPGYAELVQYWVPFYRGYGIHDSSWRTSFGETIYQTNGSHGCINISRSVMGEIYENTDVGMPVVIHN